LAPVERVAIYPIKAEKQVFPENRYCWKECMSLPQNKSPLFDESGAGRLGGLLADDALSLDLVSAFAGDRPLTRAEKVYLNNLKKRRGDAFFSDLLYVVTHQQFQPKVAKEVWDEILRHKYEMSSAIKRNIRVVVATLDYLCNLTSELKSATLISEPHINDLVKKSLLDGLTGLFNHAHCYQAIDAELKRYVRYGTAVSIIMIDIDDFKNINDRFGHQEGDKILTTIGAIISGETRDCDVCCRYGGEEFLVILPSTEIRETALLAERLRAKLEKSRPNGKMITVSMGAASAGPDTRTSRVLVKKADKALYKAKKEGKNRVVTIA